MFLTICAHLFSFLKSKITTKIAKNDEEMQSNTPPKNSV